MVQLLFSPYILCLGAHAPKQYFYAQTLRLWGTVRVAYTLDRPKRANSTHLHYTIVKCLNMNVYNSNFRKNKITPDRRQSKTLLTIDERGSKIDRNSVFDCHLSSV